MSLSLSFACSPFQFHSVLLRLREYDKLMHTHKCNNQKVPSLDPSWILDFFPRIIFLSPLARFKPYPSRICCLSPHHIGPGDVGRWSLEQPLISSLPGHTRLISIDVHQRLQVEAIVWFDQGEGLDSTTIICRCVSMCVSVCVLVCMEFV